MKHPHGLHDQRGVAVVFADLALALGALGVAAVAFAFAENASAAAFPFADHLDLAIGRGAAFHRLAAGAHHREERFAAVHAVPEEIRMPHLNGRGAECFGVHDLAQRASPCGLRGFAVT